MEQKDYNEKYNSLDMRAIDNYLTNDLISKNIDKKFEQLSDFNSMDKLIYIFDSVEKYSSNQEIKEKYAAMKEELLLKKKKTGNNIKNY